MNARLFIDGEWVDSSPRIEVRNKYSGAVIGTVPQAQRGEVEAAIGAAARAAAVMRDMPAHRRSDLLRQTAEIIRSQREIFARTIAAEAGKALKFARTEVDREVNTFVVAAEESKRIHGETVPLDSMPVGEHHFGFYVRRPVGVVAAISPFNFPSSPTRWPLHSRRGTASC